jgi:hypothetical protein
MQASLQTLAMSLRPHRAFQLDLCCPLTVQTSSATTVLGVQLCRRAPVLMLACLLAATLVDTVTSAALVTVSKRSGVSLSLSVDYLSPGTGGAEVEIDARVRPPCRLPRS